MKNLYSVLSSVSIHHLPKLVFAFSFLFLLTPSITYSQNKENILEDSYTSYFNAERETIYLHFNKHKFLLNESIWFKGYIYDKKGDIPFITSSNIYVSLYDKDGNTLKTNLYYAENGTFSGQFKVTKNLASGHYFIKAHTNWMKNFQEDESFTSETLQIINPNSETNEVIENNTSTFDLQFLPEGGHCISDVTNSIGYKIINCEGKGLMINGQIVNSKNEIINTFKSNLFGIGKFDLHMVTGESYTAKYTINNKNFETKLPISRPIGFSISLNNYTTKLITYLTLKTNKNTLLKEAGKTYYVVIHQNNKSSVINLEIDKLNLNHVIPIDNKKLPIGVNTITVFNDQLQPLLERLIFNYREGDYIKTNLTAKPISNDSIPIHINLKDNSNVAFSSNISVSVLPAETESLSTSRNIISSIYIDPYINGELENANFYFEDVNRIKSFHLDLALLTQGWSKYKWDNIKKGTQNLIIPFDKGVTINGTINETLDPKSKYQIQLFSLVNNINETRPIGEDKAFNFDNYYIQDSTKVHFSVFKDGEKIAQPKLYAKVLNKDRSSLNQIFKSPNTCSIIESNQVIELTKYADIDFKGEVLDTINLYSKNTVKQKKQENVLKYIGNAYSKGIKVGSDQERAFPFIIDIINANGFTARNDVGRITIFNRQPVSFLGSNSPLLIVDDVNFGRDYQVLTSMRTNEIDEIYFNKSGLGYGSRGGAGVIRIYLKKDLGLLSDNSLARYANSLLVSGGFADQKEFYSPLFYNKSNHLFNTYGAVDWQPKLISDKNGNIQFKIKKPDADRLLFIIEGFTVNGKLISEIKEFSISKNTNN
ncbi:hypothetical protein [Psychroserpens ponticola]|uniref:TonB-dependent receptor plug domain-containing protein n=1 Tax=Psychroserpens ponticola TaxID=2932268 RepID=A0ABY7RYM9_9FLAO|nr:hypothetical protein [Psychroserpens ponticola]WCO02261.1 hypothetical protein MUN68_001935 [Psychroserpens ponticola]